MNVIPRCRMLIDRGGWWEDLTARGNAAQFFSVPVHRVKYIIEPTEDNLRDGRRSGRETIAVHFDDVDGQRWLTYVRGADIVDFRQWIDRLG